MTLQYVRPDADSVDGGWLNESGNQTNLFASIDETVASDSDYIKSTVSLGDTAKIRLSDPSATMTTPAVIRFRVRKEGTDLTYLTARLLEGSTVRATFEYGPIPDSFTTIELALTTAEINSIVDATNLFVELASGTQSHLGGSVDLNFQAGSYYSDRQSIAVTDALSITRASIGYAKTSSGTLTQFATNTLRITDLGLLVEDARTNAVLNSQAFNSTNWDLDSTAPSFTADAIAAPDGTVTADLVDDSSSSVLRYAAASYTSGPTGSIVTSVYAKPNTSTVLWLANQSQNDTSAYFQLTGSGSFIARAGATNPDSIGIEALANGWYRCWIVSTTNTPNGNVRIAPAFRNDMTGNNASDATLTGSQYYWGAQVEAGAFPSSYIPTTSTSATRAADSINMISSLASVMSAAQGSGVASAILNPTTVSGSQRMIAADSGTGHQFLYQDGDPGHADRLNAYLYTNYSFFPGSWFTGFKAGQAWSAGAGSISAFGLAVSTGATVWDPSGSGNMYLGSNGGAGFLNGYIRRFTVWNSKLADVLLQGLTAP